MEKRDLQSSSLGAKFVTKCRERKYRVSKGTNKSGFRVCDASDQTEVRNMYGERESKRSCEVCNTKKKKKHGKTKASEKC